MKRRFRKTKLVIVSIVASVLIVGFTAAPSSAALWPTRCGFGEGYISMIHRCAIYQSYYWWIKGQR